MFADDKSGVKKRRTAIEISAADPDDDEPIGSLLKLKKPRNPKRGEDVSGSGRAKARKFEAWAKNVVLNEKDFGGMDDTLASFRKKLKAPKKDNGSSGTVMGQGSVLNVEEPSAGISDSSTMFGSFDEKSSSVNVFEGQVVGDDRSDATTDKVVDRRSKERPRKSKVASLVKENSNCAQLDHDQVCLRSGFASLHHQEKRQGHGYYSDENLEDSLSAFVRKAQSSLIKRSRTSFNSEQGRDMISDNGLSPRPKGVSDNSERARARKSQSPCVLKQAHVSVQTEKNLQPFFCVTVGNATPNQGATLEDKVSADGLCEVSNCMDGLPLPVDQFEGVSSELSLKDDVLPFSDQKVDRSCNANMEDSDVLIPVKESRDDMICKNVAEIMHCRYGRQGKESQERLAVDPCVQMEENCSATVCRSTLGMKSVKDSLRRCSMGKASGMDHDFVETPSAIFGQMEGDGGGLCGANDSTGHQQPKGVSTASHNAEQSVCSTSLENETSVRYFDDNLLGKPHKKASKDSHDKSNQKTFQSKFQSQSSYLWRVKMEDSSKSAFDVAKKEICNCCGDINIFSHTTREDDCVALPAMMSNGENGSVFATDMMQQEKRLGKEDPLSQVSQQIDPDEFVTSDLKCGSAFTQTPSSEGATKGISGPSLDHSSLNEESNEVSLQINTADQIEAYTEDVGLGAELECKDGKLSVVQRAARKARKRRHGDMAYEGDIVWDSLIYEQGCLSGDRVRTDQNSNMREKSDSSNMTVEAEDCGVAAVSSGLKACSVSPVEKILFKEILKRRGGLQEYLDCRNRILGLWSRDVSRILLLADCGVSDTPSDGESPRSSLIREIYKFLDHRGYINVGIASKKKKGEPTATHSYKLLKENNIVENSGIPAAESDDGVSFILGQFKVSEACTEEKNGSVPVDEKQTIEPAKGMALVAPRMSESSMNESVECQAGITQENGWALQSQEGNVDTSDFSPPSIVPDQGIIRDRIPKLNDDLHGAQYCSADLVEENHDMQGDSDSKKSIIVIGAGPAGLTAARHLQRQGFFVTVLEGRTRIGGRVYTDHSSLSVPVDLGASIITGVEADVATERRPDPSSLICAQLGLELTVLNSDCPLYDTVTGEKVPSKLDEALEAEYNSLLDDMVLLVAHKGEHAMRMSLEEGLEFALKRRRQSFSGTEYGGTRLNGSVGNCDSSEKFVDSNDCVKSQSEEVLSPLERRVMDWHFANLEYGCAALLQEVSLPYWNQDDVYGGFGGAHCMIKGGYSTVVESLGKGLCIHLNHVVTSVSYSTKDSGVADDQHSRVKVLTSNGSEFSGDAVLITVPLGCLKAESIKFSPPLPHWKHSSIQRLGFGVLNKVVLEFSEVFWDDSVDYFGATAEDTNQRGQCFMFWNVKKTVGAPVLIALVVGKAAIEGQTMTAANHVKHAVMVLRKLFGEALVPDPVASVVTDWGNDPFSFGAYSYVAVGASGEDYDLLARPVEDCVFFAGEATCKEHPDTVGGAMMSGLREAVRIMDILNSGNDYAAEVEAMEAQKHSDGERSEVRDLIKRLDAVELSSVLYKSPIDRAQIMSKEALLQDMFCNAKTTAGRLHLAKELLNLQIDVLKSFAGTKKGLSILNSWILDSMGKDGTQLLRHCVRILVRVSTDLLAVRLSGIGKTVREKVCVHTSRDIRAIASQLVSMWIEVFRKEKALNGGRKLLRQAAIADTSKSKPLKDLASGKPPLRMHHSAPVNRESLQYHTPGENRSPSKTNKKVDSKPAKLETMADAKSEIHSSRSLGSAGRMEPEGEVVKNFTMSEEERAAFIAADAARAAAVAAAEAYASSEVKCNTSLQLPKIPSFHKFARREQYAQMDESDARRKWNGSVLGRQDCLSEIDSRNCRVRDWSVDFSAACVNLDSSRVSVDNLSQRSQSNENACQFSLREHSGESTAVDSSIFTKAWIDTAGSVKDYHAIDRWQSQAAAVDSNLRHSTMDIREEEEDSNNISRAPMLKLDRVGKDRPFSHRTSDKELNDSGSRGAERIKQAVVDYVASLLMPLYKAKKIDKEGYKSIMKKSATKVMEQTTDREKTMTVSEFLDFKRKNKIRSFVDKLIERQMSKPVVERC